MHRDSFRTVGFVLGFVLAGLVCAGEVVAQEAPKSEAGAVELKELAAAAFRHGSERDGLKYLYAYGLTSDQGATEVIPSIQWVQGLRRPAIAVRWGVGVSVKAPSDLANNVFPLGSEQAAAKKGGAGRNAGQPDLAALLKKKKPDAAPGVAKEPAAQLKQFAVDLANKFLETHRQKIEEGAFGSPLKQAVTEAIAAKDAAELNQQKLAAQPKYRIDADGNQRVGEAFVLPNGSGREVLVSKEDFEFITGKKSTEKPVSIADALKKAKESNPDFPRPSAKELAEAAAAKAAKEESAKRLARKNKVALNRPDNILHEGAVYLGSGHQKALVEKAKAEKLDVLLVFHVEVKKPVRGNGPIVNETKMVLVDVNTATDAFVSRTLTNVAVQQAREQNGDDGIDKEIEKLVATVDTKYAMAALPATVTAERAVARVNALSNSKPEDPLPVLGEIKLYHLKGLIQDADLIRAYDGLLGAGQGAKLAQGTFEERKAAIQKWLP